MIANVNATLRVVRAAEPMVGLPLCLRPRIRKPDPNALVGTVARRNERQGSNSVSTVAPTTVRVSVVVSPGSVTGETSAREELASHDPSLKKTRTVRNELIRMRSSGRSGM